jgi:hypothetical protein
MSGTRNNEAAEHHDKFETLEMGETNVQINFDASAVLRKWPSLQNAPISASDGGRPYSIFEGTLDDCIRQFMAKPASQRHLFEIHTSSALSTR